VTGARRGPSPGRPRHRPAGTVPASGGPDSLGRGMTGEWWGTDAVSVEFGQVLALDQVTFHAMPGQVSAVVGGDGAGRTTLLRCLAGALAVSRGQVRRPPARRIGFLSAGSGTYPDLTVAQNLAFRAAVYGVSAADRSAEYLERAGLSEARDRLAGRLSGGMRQKLGVIAAMLHEPALLVLDEPTTGVDPVSRVELWSLIAGAAADGAAVVLATSYLDEAERASHVLALDAGRQLAAGTPDQITASMPGTLRAVGARPAGDGARRAWRRNARWQVWSPGDSPPSDGELIRPDLQDAVTVAALIRELATSAPDPVMSGGERR
jgi:ABC-type multidrug transport system ATPase subunit